MPFWVFILNTIESDSIFVSAWVIFGCPIIDSQCISGIGSQQQIIRLIHPDIIGLQIHGLILCNGIIIQCDVLGRHIQHDRILCAVGNRRVQRVL